MTPTGRRIYAGLLGFTMLLGGAALAGAGSNAPPAPPAPAPPAPAAPAAPPSPAAPPAPTTQAAPAPAAGQAQEAPAEATPPRVSYLHGDVSLWRPGAQDWTAAAHWLTSTWLFGR